MTKYTRWAVERLREASTWRGLAEQIEGIVAVGLLVIGLINVGRREPRKVVKKDAQSGLMGLLLLFVALPAFAGTYSGTINAFGYQPPSSVVVYWRTFAGGDVTRRLNPSVLWSGSNSDAVGYIGRYAEGKTDVLGRWIASQGVETQGAMAYLILQALFRQAGISRDPSPQEVLDFGVVHGGQRQLGCSDYVALVGKPDPTCKDNPGGGNSKLRAQPTDPPGCCKPTLPCTVEVPGRKPGEVWSEAVLTPQGGRKGCTLRQVEASNEPEPEPGEGNGDGAPLTSVRCFSLRLEGNVVSGSEVSCEVKP